MNIGTYYNAMPDVDTALETWPGEQMAERCLCVYGVTEAQVAAWFTAVNTRAEELAQNVTEVTVKPLLWFDNLEALLDFTDFANGLEDREFCDLLTELQRDYNTPWTYAQKLNSETVRRIAENWERRYDD